MKILKYLLIALLLLVGAGALYIASSGPELPAHTAQTLDNVFAQPLPDIVKGDTATISAGGVDIWYEHLTPPDTSKGVALLIMGISNDALGWPNSFVDLLLDAGYEVVRYDHRGTGLSDWMPNWNSSNPYGLTDMAGDAVAILDAINTDKAHIVGVSMGGMIAQEFAILYPERVETLTSIMSSAHITDPNLPPISGSVAFALIRVALKYGVIGGEKNTIKMHLASRAILMGDADYPLNIQEMSEQTLYNIRERRGYNSKVSPQHQAAVMQSDARYEALGKLSMPALVIHGQNDPFIPMAHGQRTASALPNADTMWIANMGHDIPAVHAPTIVNKLVSHFESN
ncbi:MAG: alpha/beta hydrolase [Bacteroidota bacterium]